MGQHRLSPMWLFKSLYRKPEGPLERKGDSGDSIFSRLPSKTAVPCPQHSYPFVNQFEIRDG